MAKQRCNGRKSSSGTTRRGNKARPPYGGCTGRAYEQVLTESLTRGAERDLDSLIVPGLEYPIYTPFGNEAAAQVLLDALKAHQAKKDESK